MRVDVIARLTPDLKEFSIKDYGSRLLPLQTLHPVILSEKGGSLWSRRISFRFIKCSWIHCRSMGCNHRHHLKTSRFKALAEIFDFAAGLVQRVPKKTSIAKADLQNSIAFQDDRVDGQTNTSLFNSQSLSEQSHSAVEPRRFRYRG